MKVLRIYHAGRDQAHRARDRALLRAGIDLTLVVPARWHDPGSEEVLSEEPFAVVEIPVRRPGDVNRHSYDVGGGRLTGLIAEQAVELLDVHEEPFSVACRQWLKAAPADLPVVAYTAQNVDKRLPPPFHQYERGAYSRLAGIYPCSAQAASVSRGKGFRGRLEVLPLGYDERLIHAGDQAHTDDVFVLGLVGRLVPEKGGLDALEVLRAVSRTRPARLVAAGRGPQLEPLLQRAKVTGLAHAVDVVPWSGPATMAELYRRMHVVLVPSRATTTWVEQFGRVIVEAQASGAVVAGYMSGAIPEVVDRGGVLVEEGRVDALAAAVERLASDEPAWLALRRDGLATSASRTWTEVGRRQADLYREVLTGSPSTRPVASSSSSRAQAVAEFGPTAMLPGGVRRPFALPLLREDTAVSRSLARLIDSFGR